MVDLIKEHKELFKNQILDYINGLIDTTKSQLKSSVESCDKNYFGGSLDTLSEVKNYIKEM